MVLECGIFIVLVLGLGNEDLVLHHVVVCRGDMAVLAVAVTVSTGGQAVVDCSDGPVQCFSDDVGGGVLICRARC